MISFKILSILLIITVLQVIYSTSDDQFIPRPQLNGGVRGRRININQAPYHVSIETPYGRSCSGSIVSNRHVLTAAHCVWRRTKRWFTIRIATSRVGRGGEIFRISRIIIHPDYDPRTQDRDLALIEIVGSITFGPQKQPIEVDYPEAEARALVPSTSTGFNRLALLPGTNDLQELTGSLVSNENCFAYWSNTTTDSMTCFNTDGGTCQGDSGAPLVDGTTQTGVASFGYGCTRPSSPGVYANLDVVWIRNITSITNITTLDFFY